ncbi:MAG: RHS repeat protein [Gammaproteobacteria bacterium]|nr:RHS repeat protein [Gammaproteobacteria bacterium]MDH5652442.1 RHS repeat protein [Gammaproteobacteria bacterium]
MTEIGESVNVGIIQDKDEKKETHWVEVDYVYPDGLPVEGTYVATDSEGIQYSGILNDKGGLRLNGLPSGSVEIELLKAAEDKEFDEIRKSIKAALDEMIAEKKAEAAQDEERLKRMSDAEKAGEHGKAFAEGLWNGAVGLVEFAWDTAKTAAEIAVYLSPVERMNNLLHAAYKTYKSGSMTEEKWLASLSDNMKQEELKDITRILGFDPSKIDPAVFSQAYELTAFIADDDATLKIFKDFAKEYVDAQSSLDWAEFAGGGVFEIVLAALLAVFTGGAGNVAQAASKVRHTSRLTKLGSVFRRLLKLLKRRKLSKKIKVSVDGKKKLKAKMPKAKKVKKKKGKKKKKRKNKGGKNKNKENAQSNKNSCTRGCPISMTSGEEILEQVDFVLPGPMPLVWNRTYRSSNDENTGMGTGWTVPWFTRLEVDEEEEEAIWHDGEGREIPFDLPDESDEYYNEVEKFTLYADSKHSYRIVTEDNEIWHFGGEGRFKQLQAFSNLQGHKISFAHNETGQLDTITDSAGRKLQLAYQRDLLHTVTICDRTGKPLQPLVTYSHDGNQDLVAVADAAMNTERFEYKNHIITKRTTPDGFNLYFTWDEYSKSGKCLRNWGDRGIYDYRFEYDKEKQITRSTDGRNTTTVFHYNELGLITKEIDAEGGVTENEYNEAGKLIKVTDPLGNVTEYSYTHEGKIESIADALGQETAMQYDMLGNLIGLTDAAGNAWQRQYDDLGRLLEAADPAGNTTKYTYNEQNLPDTVTDALGNTHQLFWDKHGQLIMQIDAEQQRTTYQHDLLGRVTGITDHEQQQTLYRYDPVGNLTHVKLPDGSLLKMTYTPGGRLQTYTDALKRTTRYEYDGLSQPIARIDALGRVFKYEYDAERNLTALINENGDRYELAYDKNERLIREKGFDGRIQSYEYNAAGHLINYLDGMDRLTEFVRDPLGQLLEKHCKRYDPKSEEDDKFVEEEVVTFGYDELGRLVEAANDSGELAFAWDETGNLLSESINGQAIEHSYNELGQLISSLLPTGQTIQYGYNKQGLFTLAALDDQILTRIERNKLGYETQRNMGSLTAQREYDPMGRLLSQRTANQQKPILARNYSYDLAGNLHQIEDMKQGSTWFSYDPLDRLKGVTGLQNEQFDFDPAGNILSTTTRQQGGYVKGNRLQVFQDYRFNYDDTGNLIEERKGRHTSQFHYNVQNQLTKVEKDGQTFEYKYDPLGRRISKSDNFGDTVYLWSGDTLISEERQNLQTTYIYEPYSFVPLCQVKDKKIYYYHNDHIGTPQIMTDARGDVVWEAKYKVYGNVAGFDVQNIENPLRFQGQYFDKETGLHYNRHRYYHPVIGRFTSVDPIGLEGGANNYEYAPNPISWIDPLGLSAKKGDCPVETPHTRVTGGKEVNAPKTSQPNSIHEHTRPDGSKSVTYYDEKGRMFSREDYGQQRTHGQLGRGPDGRSVPHEHRVDYSDKGPIGKRYRELDSRGKPVGPWYSD